MKGKPVSCICRVCIDMIRMGRKRQINNNNNNVIAFTQTIKTSIMIQKKAWSKNDIKLCIH